MCQSFFVWSKWTQRCSTESQSDLLIMACSHSPGDQVRAGFPPPHHRRTFCRCTFAGRPCGSRDIFVCLVRLRLKQGWPGAMGRIKECFQSSTPQLPVRLRCLPPCSALGPFPRELTLKPPFTSSRMPLDPGWVRDQLSWGPGVIFIFIPTVTGWGYGVPVVRLCRRAGKCPAVKDWMVQCSLGRPSSPTQARFAKMICLLLKAPHLRCAFRWRFSALRAWK